MRGLANKLALMFESVTSLVFDGAGNVSSKGAGEEPLDSEVGFHFGFYSRPNDGGAGIVAKPDGKGGGSILIAFRHHAYEISLEKGEVAMAASNACYVKLDQNRNAIIEVPVGAQIRLGASASQSAIKGDDYRAAEDTLFGALSTCVGLEKTLAQKLAADAALASDTKTAATALASGITTFVGAITTFTGLAATFKSDVVKVS